MAEQTQKNQQQAEELKLRSGFVVDDLTKQENVRDLQDEMDKYYATFEYDDLFKDAIKLEKAVKQKYRNLEQENLELYDQLRNIIAKANWATLNRQTPPYVEQLFSDHFEFFLGYDWQEVLSNIETVLLAYPSFDERNAVKNRFRGAIAKSQATIGDNDITLADENTEPTVANWLRDWRDFLKDRSSSPLFVVEYLNTSPNARALTDKQRKQLEGMLKFYLEMAKDSKTAEGTETKALLADPVTGHWMQFEKGEMVDTGVEVPEDDLKTIRYAQGYTEDGKQLSYPKLVERYYVDLEDRIEKTLGKGEEGAAATPPPATPTPVQKPQQPKPQPVAPQLKPQEPEMKPEMEAAPLPPLPELEPAPAPPEPPVQKKPEPLKPITVPAPKPMPAPLPPKPKAAAPSGKLDEGEIAERVLAELALLLDNFELERRFLSILTSYLKGVRNKTEATEALIKAPQEGGVNLPAKKAEEVLATADQLLEQEKKAPRRGAAKAPTGPGAAKPTFEMAQQRIEQREKAERTMHKEEAPNKEEEIEDIFANVGSADMTPFGPPPPPPTEPRLQGISDLTAKKPPSRGASAAPKVMNPTDELRNMSLEEFQRFSREPREASGKIIEKLDLLEQESITKKAEGIEAWKKSPMNQLYLTIGNESLAQNISVNEVISMRKNEGKETLTEAEFDAIADLNSKIRF
ncbi:MAG: hypothetical protein ABIG66_02620 [Candidatus Kerfeldbacteria bacterium]